MIYKTHNYSMRNILVAIYMTTRPRARACIFHKTLGLMLYLLHLLHTGIPLLISSYAEFSGLSDHSKKYSTPYTIKHHIPSLITFPSISYHIAIYIQIHGRHTCVDIRSLMKPTSAAVLILSYADRKADFLMVTTGRGKSLRKIVNIGPE